MLFCIVHYFILYHITRYMEYGYCPLFEFKDCLLSWLLHIAQVLVQYHSTHTTKYSGLINWGAEYLNFSNETFIILQILNIKSQRLWSHQFPNWVWNDLELSLSLSLTSKWCDSTSDALQNVTRGVTGNTRTSSIALTNRCLSVVQFPHTVLV